MGTTRTRRGTNILSDILSWCGDIPGWQQDALRRIVEKGQLDASDVEELTILCRHANGISEEEVPELQPLRAEHIPAGRATGQRVTLRSVSHVENVNALDDEQEVAFAPAGLTVIFGYNGSGKSGYGRVLRRACRARTKGDAILPNVLKANPKSPASAEICYALDDAEQPPEQWIDDQRQIDALGSISFFDSACAAVHVRQRNDIAFTPFGLDVLPTLGAACKDIQKKLDGEKRKLDAIQPKFLKSAHATGTSAVARLLTSLQRNTNVDELESLASLSDEEVQRLKDLPAQLVADPAKIAKELRTRAGRISSLKNRIVAAAESLSPDDAQQLKDLAEDAARKAKTAEAAAKMSFADDPLPEIGEAIWRELWEAARRYSAVAYPDRGFPVVDQEGDVCVLCQQPLGNDAKDRLQRFETFVADDTAKQAQAAKDALKAAVTKLESLGLQDDVLREQLKDVEFASAETLEKTRSKLASLLLILRQIKKAYKSADWSFELPADGDDVGDDLAKLVEGLEQQANESEKSSDAEERKKLENELAELRAREWLATVLGDVKEQITRLGEMEKYKASIAQTRTNRITVISKELAKQYVTDQLRDAFATELKKMQQGVRRLNVELTAAPGEFGTSYYRVQLVGAHNADIGSVVSEGEHRCIALAGFLSELATEQSKSAIIFDDPVTSLDHHWRECFARRLVEEAFDRQVIVFTHDIVFLHDLVAGAERRDIPIELRRVQTNRDNCGFVNDGLPWIAQKTVPRIDELEKRARATRTDYDNHNDEVYERDIGGIYSDLRATVERAIEEHLFRGVVLRHRDYISLNNLKLVTAVTTDHCERLQKLFQRCCDITSAHDRASLRSFGVPSPDDALDDLAELKAVVVDVKDKQKSIS